MHRSHEAGQVNPLILSNIATGVLVVVLTGLCIWLFMGYNHYKSDADALVADAASKAKTEQQKTDEAQFLEREKVPTRTFQGPSDLGSVSFQYPKTWSVYTAKTTPTLEAYLYPSVVPPVSSTQPFAVRVLVEDKTYETVVKSYESQVKKAELRSNPVTVQGYTGIRLDGKFSASRDGSAVIFKVRDKSLTIATDASAYKNDFEQTILTSLKFNP